MDNLSEYQTPELYDAEYGAFKDDFNVFVGLKNQGSALDLACGTGRLTIALAKSGLSCVGLDANALMLACAKKKSKGLNIDYEQGDMKDFHMSQKFDLITLAGNAFQALLSNEDQESLLYCVKTHLNAEGIFAFNTRNPRPEDRRTTPDYEFWHDFKDPKGQLVTVCGKQIYDPSQDTVHYTTKRIWPNGETLTDIELRFTSLDFLEQSLAKCGFEVVNLYGDFDKNPYLNTSHNIIMICRRKNAAITSDA